jgi:hypothetical protein
MKYSELKKVEVFARCNSSKTSHAAPKWDVWCENWINQGNDYLVTSIDNYHHARKIIKSIGKRCTAAVASGNGVTIHFE